MGENSCKIATIYSNIGNLYSKQGQLELAETYHMDALRIFQMIHKDLHSDIAYAFTNIGKLRKKQGKVEVARTLFEKALIIYTQIYGPEHIQVGELQEMLNEV